MSKELETLDDILEDLAEDYYPYHEYSDIYKDINKKKLEIAKQAILAWHKQEVLKLIGDDIDTTPLMHETGFAHIAMGQNQEKLRIREAIEEV